MRLGPNERGLGPKERGLGPKEKGLGPKERGLGPKERGLGPNNRPISILNNTDIVLLCLQAAEIESKRMEGMLQIVMLKKLNRLAHIRCKKVRDGTNEVSSID